MKGDVFYVVLECTAEDDEERPTKTAEAIADTVQTALVGTFIHCDYVPDVVGTRGGPHFILKNQL